MEVTGSSRKEEDQGDMTGTEGGRGPTAAPAASATSADSPPAVPSDPEVLEKPVRRRFSAEYKLRILEEADRCSESGGLGALLRREGLYSSHLTTWRRQREEGILGGLTPKKRGRKARAKNPLEEENRRLRRETQRLAAKLKQAETIIDVQKKLCEALGLPTARGETSDNEE